MIQKNSDKCCIKLCKTNTVDYINESKGIVIRMLLI